jgi:hypothetical protein
MLKKNVFLIFIVFSVIGSAQNSHKDLQYDCTIVDARMSFFEYADYNLPEQLNDFHKSSHYGRIPLSQINSENFSFYFNVIIQNNGLQTVTPRIKILISDLQQNIVFESEKFGGELYSNQTDTIDFNDTDYGFADLLEIGEYIIYYELLIDGYEDENPDDNIMTDYFLVDDYFFSRETGNITGFVSPKEYDNGGNTGDKIATDFYFVEDTEIQYVYIFVDAENTTVGSSFIVYIETYDEEDGEWGFLSSSSLTIIEPEDLGQWIEISMIENANIELGNNEIVKARVSIDFFYDDFENGLFIGTDTSNQHSSNGTYWYFTQGEFADQWINIDDFAAGLAIRLHCENINPIYYTVNYEIIGNGNGTISATYNGNIINSGDSVIWYSYINFVAQAFEGYQVKEWRRNGSFLSNENEIEIFLYGDAYVTVEFELTNSVYDNFIYDNIEIYPNPVNETLFFKGESTFKNIFVYDLEGKKVLFYDSSNNNKIDVTSLCKGTYIIKFEEANGNIQTMMLFKE